MTDVRITDGYGLRWFINYCLENDPERESFAALMRSWPPLVLDGTELWRLHHVLKDEAGDDAVNDIIGQAPVKLPAGAVWMETQTYQEPSLGGGGHMMLSYLITQHNDGSTEEHFIWAHISDNYINNDTRGFCDVDKERASFVLGALSMPKAFRLVDNHVPRQAKRLFKRKTGLTPPTPKYLRLGEIRKYDGPASPSGVRQRLHLVRGHCRRYPDRTVWVDWHWRGDPSLGVVPFGRKVQPGTLARIGGVPTWTNQKISSSEPNPDAPNPSQPVKQKGAEKPDSV